jgi:ParB family chromosome partitioning protein
MATSRSALGRGLGALLPSSPAKPTAISEPMQRGGEAPASLDSLGGSALRSIPVSEIDPNPEQPRRHFNPEHLEELANSVSRHGVLQPVVVRRAGNRYELIVGERRWRASRAAGLETIPAVISDVDSEELLELAIVENVQRHDLNPIELAHAYSALARGGATQEEIGRRVGLERSSIANHLRLLDLSREIQEDVEAGRLSMGHAKALLQTANTERRRHLRDRIVAEQLSVRDTEQLARDSGKPASAKTPRAGARAADPNIQNLVEILQKQLQTRVRIQGSAERGRIEIQYFGAEDLNRITRQLLEG